VEGAGSPGRRGVVVPEAVADAAVDQAVGLEPVHEVHKLPRLRWRDRSRRVEPDAGDGTVVGQQLLDLRHRLAPKVAREVAALRREVPRVADRVALVPVLRLRVVEPQTQAFGPARIRQLPERVAAEGRGVHDVVRADRGLEHGEAVVVLGRDHDVPHARGLGQPDPLESIEPRGVETPGDLLIFRHRDFGALHHPLGDAEVPLPLPFPRKL